MSKPSKAAIEAAMKIKLPGFLDKYEITYEELSPRERETVDKAAAIIDEAAKGLVDALKYYADKRIYDENGAPDMSEVADAALADWRTE